MGQDKHQQQFDRHSRLKKILPARLQIIDVSDEVSKTKSCGDKLCPTHTVGEFMLRKIGHRRREIFQHTS